MEFHRQQSAGARSDMPDANFARSASPVCRMCNLRWGLLIVFSLGSGSIMAQAPPTDPKPRTSAKRTDDLSKRLLRRAMKQADEDVMEQVLRLMGESAHRMEIDFDAGAGTQELQQQVVAKLDEAIASAAKNHRKQRQQDSASQSDKRRRSKSSSQERESSSQQPGQQITDAGSTPGDPTSVAAEQEQTGGEFADIRRAWGHLPPREREELIQGSTEEYLERYRLWVERYYRALQEAGSSSEPR